MELNLYIRGEEAEEDESVPEAEAVPEAEIQPEPDERREAVKVAYWPGCVSRGFTPELHGSMALVAERLGIELVELDRANCCGAGVIAEHNQELADTLNARTFALAQQTGLPMMNICSTCQGAQSECQQRLARLRVPLAHQRDARRGGPRLRPRGLLQQELPLGAGRGLRARPAHRAGDAAARRPPRRPLLRLLHPPPQAPARLRGASRARPLPRPADRGARRRGRRSTTAPASAAASRSSRWRARSRCGRPAPTSATRSTPVPTAWSPPARSATSTSTCSSPRPPRSSTATSASPSCISPSSSASRSASSPSSSA